MSEEKSKFGRFKQRARVIRKRYSRERFWLSTKGLISLLLSVLVIWAIWAGITAVSYTKLEDAALAGDKFGGITALFSGLAFAGLIFTLFVQKKELEYQRKELTHLVTETRETKDHLEAQAHHLKSQSDFVGKQTFENSFFQLLASFNANLQSITVQDRVNGPDIKGADALEVIYRRAYNSLKAQDVGFHNNYHKFYAQNKNDLGPYFRQMYNILKFLKNSEVKEKAFYSNVLRAQLTSAELSLLAANCCSSFGRRKMAPLVKEFDFLKHFDNEAMLDLDDELSNFFLDWGLNVLPSSWR